jgi:hypothetical protein
MKRAGLLQKILPFLFYYCFVPYFRLPSSNILFGSFVNKVHQSLYLIGIYGSKEKAPVTMKTGIFLVRQPQRPGSNRCTYRVSKNS